jgi:homoserine kinase
VIVRAPATSANLGPGFDTAAVALDLWNELRVEPGEGVEIDGAGAEELARDASHLTLRAFAQFAPVAGNRFSFVNRVPLERGLGSSASAIALGLVAGARAAGVTPSVDELLAAGTPLEGHGDNLAAALLGGVTLYWDGHARRIADDLPLVPVVVVPDERTSTTSSRASLPDGVSRDDAVTSAIGAALLGAAIATGDAEMLHAAFRDRLHEPYRSSPLLERLRALHPATLSGSGPSVVVWASRGEEDAVAAEVGGRVLAVATAGAL